MRRFHRPDPSRQSTSADLRATGLPYIPRIDALRRRRNCRSLLRGSSGVPSTALLRQLQIPSSAIYFAVDVVGLGTCEFTHERCQYRGESHFLGEVNRHVCRWNTPSARGLRPRCRCEQLTSPGMSATVKPPAARTPLNFRLCGPKAEPRPRLTGTLTKLAWPSGGHRVIPGVVEGKHHLPTEVLIDDGQLT